MPHRSKRNRLFALLLLACLLLPACTKQRKSAEMLVNGSEITCWQLDSGDYYSGSLRSLVNYLGLRPTFPWYHIPQEVVAAGGSLQATPQTDTILDAMNYFAWDYRPNDTDVPRLQIILERFGFTETRRITSRWLLEHIADAVSLADMLQKEAMGFATFCHDTAACKDTTSYVPAFQGREACMAYPQESLTFWVNDEAFEAIRWSGTNGQYCCRPVQYTIDAFCLQAGFDAQAVATGSYTVSPTEATAAMAAAVNLLAWEERFAGIPGTAALRSCLEGFGLSPAQPLTGEWLCAHFGEAVTITGTLPPLYLRHCAGVPGNAEPEQLAALLLPETP